MGAVRKRGGVWWIRYCRNGKRYEESSRSKRKGDATRLLQLREGDSARGIPVTPKIGRLTFDTAVGEVLNDYEVNAKKALDDITRKVTLHLQPYFGGRRMVAITTADIRLYVKERQEAEAANAQINRELSILKRAFKLAMQAGKLLAMPHIPMLAENNIRQGFFEAEAFGVMRAQLPAALQGIVTFAYLTGWRIRSEVLTLTWGQVDREAKVVRLNPGQTKNKQGRTLPYSLLPELQQVIDAQWKVHEIFEAHWKAGDAEWRKGRTPTLVFHRNGKPIRNFYKAWQQACAAAGVPDLIPHDLRRTAVRNLVRAGVPEKTAMVITGHLSRSVFDRYAITNESDVQAALGKIAHGPIVGQNEKTGTEAAKPESP